MNNGMILAYKNQAFVRVNLISGLMKMPIGLAS
jgi:uncharacterized integral membrane protein